MNRLWVRFALVIIGILLAVIILPFFLGPFVFARASDSPALDPRLAEYFRDIPPDVRELLEQQVIDFGRNLIIRTGIIVAVAGMIVFAVARKRSPGEGNSGLMELGSLLGKVGEFHGIPVQSGPCGTAPESSQFGRARGF